jgi:hypothetical protein
LLVNLVVFGVHYNVLVLSILATSYI